MEFQVDTSGLNEFMSIIKLYDMIVKWARLFSVNIWIDTYHNLSKSTWFSEVNPGNII